MAISPQMNSAATNYHSPPYVSNSGAPEVPEELRCQYASKHCDQERTTKKCGGLHKFCAYHRENANRNQMRVDRRRRLAKQQAQIEELKRKTMMANSNVHVGTAATTTSFTQRGGRRSPRSERFDPVGRHPTSPGASTQNPLEPLVFDSQPVLDPQDLYILQELLFHDDQQDSPMAMVTMDMDHPPAGATVAEAARNPYLEEYAAMNPSSQGVYLI